MKSTLDLPATERSVADELRSKDAVETAIERSKDASQKWESALPSRDERRWSERSATAAGAP